MDNQQARFILQSCRSSGRDADDPRFTEAQAVADQHPELAARLEKERTSDLLFAARLKEIPVPSDLQTRISAGVQEMMRARALSRRHRKIVALALAASVILLLSIAGAWVIHGRAIVAANGFPHYRDEMVSRLDERLQLSFTSERPEELQHWLESNRGVACTTIPGGLRLLPGIGCRTFTWNGRPAGLICFAVDGGQAVHLIVVSSDAVPHAPKDNVPEWKQVGDWQTASWNRDGTVYMLAGRMNRESLEKLL